MVVSGGGQDEICQSSIVSGQLVRWSGGSGGGRHLSFLFRC